MMSDFVLVTRINIRVFFHHMLNKDLVERLNYFIIIEPYTPYTTLRYNKYNNKLNLASLAARPWFCGRTLLSDCTRRDCCIWQRLT